MYQLDGYVAGGVTWRREECTLLASLNCLIVYNAIQLGLVLISYYLQVLRYIELLLRLRLAMKFGLFSS